MPNPTKTYNEFVDDINEATNKGQLTSLSNEYDKDVGDANTRLNDIAIEEVSLRNERFDLVSLELSNKPLITDLIAKKIGLLELGKPT